VCSSDLQGKRFPPVLPAYAIVFLARSAVSLNGHNIAQSFASRNLNLRSFGSSLSSVCASCCFGDGGKCLITRGMWRCEEWPKRRLVRLRSRTALSRPYASISAAETGAGVRLPRSSPALASPLRGTKTIKKCPRINMRLWTSYCICASIL
jgi:hypothetical protein